jgi:hypothetical protein
MFCAVMRALMHWPALSNDALAAHCFGPRTTAVLSAASIRAHAHILEDILGYFVHLLHQSDIL